MTRSKDITVPGTCYVVGGTVRDQLLDPSTSASDCDWVVVGTTAEAMKAAGFKDVGAGFPVFLHPVTGEEYALARTEKKHGKGHKGFKVNFDPSVLLEEDLERRDLTINAMALHPSGSIIDPFGGQRDIANQTLRHVSAAFAEDPLRVYRVARFAAKFPKFSVSQDTLELMTSMSAELFDLSAERVWLEFSKAMESAAPYKFFQTIHKVNAIQPWFTHLELEQVSALLQMRNIRSVDAIAAMGWIHNYQVVDPFLRNLKAPSTVVRLTGDVARFGHQLCELSKLSAEVVLEMFLHSHAFRPGDAFAQLIRTTEAISDKDLSGCVKLAQEVKSLRVKAESPEQYQELLKQKRLSVIENRLADS